MGRVKDQLIDLEDLAEPCPADFKTKKECDAYFNEKPLKRDIDPFWDASIRIKQSDGVPFSINHLGDNAEAWLDDEPWRKW